MSLKHFLGKRPTWNNPDLQSQLSQRFFPELSDDETNTCLIQQTGTKPPDRVLTLEDLLVPRDTTDSLTLSSLLTVR